MCSLCPKTAVETVTTNTSIPRFLNLGGGTAAVTGRGAARPCGFLGCQNVIPAPDFPWSMCDPCYGHWSDVDDSEMED